MEIHGKEAEGDAGKDEEADKSKEMEGDASLVSIENLHFVFYFLFFMRVSWSVLLVNCILSFCVMCFIF